MARYLLTLSAFKYFASVKGRIVLSVICMNPDSPSAFSFGSFRFFALLRLVKRLMQRAKKGVSMVLTLRQRRKNEWIQSLYPIHAEAVNSLRKKASKNSFFFLRAATQCSQPTSASSALSHHTVRLRRRTTRPRLHPRHRNRPDYLPTDPPDYHTLRECLPMVFSARRCH